MNISNFMRTVSSKKNKVKHERIMQVKRYYLSMYRCYSIMLYDRGYIDDPTVFDREQLINNIFDLGLINVMRTPIGKIRLESDQCLYAMYKVKDDKEKYDFLSLLYNMLKYREYAVTVDKIYEVNKFGQSTGRAATVKIAMCNKGGNIVQKSGIPFDECLARCISELETETKTVNINETIWHLALLELGIPEEEIYNGGIFEGSFSHEEEVECVKGILSGFYPVSCGKYTKLLNDWLYSHVWNGNSLNKADTLNLYDYVFASYGVEIFEVLSSIADTLSEDDDNEILAIDGANIYYNAPRTKLCVPYGVFAVACDVDCSEDFLPKCSVLDGLTGELYTEDRLIEDGINYVGCPILMHSSDTGLTSYYDIEQTDVSSASWFRDQNNNSVVIAITFDDSADMRIKYNSLPTSSLADRLYKGYVGSLMSSDLLIAEMPFYSGEDIEVAKRELIKKGYMVDD